MYNQIEKAKELLVKAQNCNLSEVEKLHKQIADENFGLCEDVLSKLWKEAWESDCNVHFPEIKNNHDIRYLLKIIEVVSKE